MSYRPSIDLSTTGGAEGDDVRGRLASESAGSVVVSVAVGRRARGLEWERVFRRRARRGRAVSTSATVLRCSECRTCAFAPDH